jgi:hypothetical protein
LTADAERKLEREHQGQFYFTGAGISDAADLAKRATTLFRPGQASNLAISARQADFG